MTTGLVLQLTLAKSAAADVRTEAAALQAIERAEEDFLAARYAAGIAKLKRALHACGAERCGDEVRAELLRDEGAQQFRAGKRKAAKKSWALARELEPSITLTFTYDSPDVREAFDEARGVRGSAADASEAPATTESGSGSTTRAEGGIGGPPASAGSRGATNDTRGEQPQSTTHPRGEKAERKAAGESNNPAATTAKSAEQGKVQEYRRFWIGWAGTIEFTRLSAGQNLCQLDGTSPANGGYYCTYNGGSDFPPRDATGQQINDLLQPGRAANVKDSFALGNVRLLLAVDYAVTPNILLGARVGVSLFTYPGAAAANDGRTLSVGRLHAELRGTVVFGSRPLVDIGIAPILFVAEGVSQFDAHASDTIVLQSNLGGGPVRIWRVDGPLFFAVGAGTRWAFMNRIVATAALRANLAASSVLTPTFGPEMDVQYGF